jgi:nucleoside-diphosphate-sugar epimerase
MNILVTGGAGYIGSILVPELLKAGHRVTVLDNFMFGQFSLAACCSFDGFKGIRGDCRDETLIKGLLADVDVVIPLAALVGAPICDLDNVGARSTNLHAIELLCRHTSKHQIVLMPVTNSGYGIAEKEQVCTEESPLNPISLYAATKVAAEKIVLERENSITFRLATVFGVSPRMRLDLLVNDFTYRAFRDRAIVLFEANFKRNFIHVQDVASVFLHGINNFDRMKGRTFNVGLDDANLSKRELCDVIRKHVPNFISLEAPIGEDPDKRDYVVSNQRLLGTGFTTKWTLDDGIIELLKGYRMLRSSNHSNI